MSEPLRNLSQIAAPVSNKALQVVPDTSRDGLAGHPSAHGAIRNPKVQSKRRLPLRPVERSSGFDEKVERHWSPVIVENPKRAVVASEGYVATDPSIAGIGFEVEIIACPLWDALKLPAIVKPLVSPIRLRVSGTHKGIPSGVNVPVLVNVGLINIEQFAVVIVQRQPVPQIRVDVAFPVKCAGEALVILKHQFRVILVGVERETGGNECVMVSVVLNLQPLAGDRASVVLGVGADINGGCVNRGHGSFPLTVGLMPGFGLIAIDASPTDWRRKKSALRNQNDNRGKHCGLRSKGDKAKKLVFGHGSNPSVVGLIATTADPVDRQGKKSGIPCDGAESAVIVHCVPAVVAHDLVMHVSGAIANNGRVIAVGGFAERHTPAIAEFFGFVHNGSPTQIQRDQFPADKQTLVLNSGRVNTEMQRAA